MLTSRALLLPSVPTMLIDEQRGDFTEMIEAVTAAGERLAAERPDVLVALSARWVSTGPFHADDARDVSMGPGRWRSARARSNVARGDALCCRR